MMAPTFLSASCVGTEPSNQKYSPEVLLTTLSTMPKVVDFPEPFGPKIPYTWPFSMLSETWLTANIGPYRLLRFLRVRMVSKTKIFGGWTDKLGKCYRIFALVFG